MEVRSTTVKRWRGGQTYWGHYRDLNSAHEFSIPDRCYTRPDLIYTHESRHYVSQSVEYARIISLINSLTRLRVCNIRVSSPPSRRRKFSDFPSSFLPSFLPSLFSFSMCSGTASSASFKLRGNNHGSHSAWITPESILSTSQLGRCPRVFLQN